MPPTVKLNGRDLLLSYESGWNGYAKTLGSDLGRLNTTEAYVDVRLHCENGIVFTANRLVLIGASKLFQDIFSDSCNCSTFVSPIYDVIFPGNGETVRIKLTKKICRVVYLRKLRRNFVCELL